MGRACDMPSETPIEIPPKVIAYTPGPDEPESGTVSHTHIRKLSFSILY